MTTSTTTYEHGRAAALRGAWRVLANADSDHERSEWLRGYDDARREMQAK